MALSASTVWEVRTTGNDTNGGAFVTGASGTDYSQQAAAQHSLTGLTTAAADAVILTAAAAAAMVGNILNITAGTNFTTGRYEILSVVVGVSITVDRNCATAAGVAGTCEIGGALASPGLASGQSTVTNTIYIKFGSYTISSATLGVSNGRVAYQNRTVIGYDTTRTKASKDANRPTLTASGIATVAIVAATDEYNLGAVRNVIVDGANLTGIIGFNGVTATGHMWRCKAVNCPDRGFSSVQRLVLCHAVACGIGIVGGIAYNCVVSDCTSHGYSGVDARYCIADTNGGQGIADSVAPYGCTIYGNASHGVSIGEYQRVGMCQNNLIVSNGGYGLMLGGNNGAVFLLTNALYNNTSGQFSGVGDQGFETVTLTANPFVDAPNGNFALNNTAGGGAACRVGAAAGVFPGGLTTGYLDIGAVQHQDPAGASGTPAFASVS